MDTILFFHRGTSWYLYYSVKQARRFHPKARIVVLTDVSQPELSPYAEIVDCSPYWSEAEEFAAIYCHHSKNSVEFERLCFQRWFVIDAYLGAHPSKRMIYLDSDVLCYDNLFADFTRPGDWALTVVDWQGPFTMMIRDRGAIRSLCDHITHLFTHEAHTFPALMAEWNKDGDVAAVTDMHALHTCLSKHAIPHLDLAQPWQGTVYDNYLDIAGLFEADQHGYKAIRMDGGIPFGRLARTGEAIRFKTLHHHGAAKHRIVRHFTARDAWYFRDRLLAKLPFRKKSTFP